MDVEKIVRDYLPHVVHMSLATVKGNAPWVCEVHFAYDDDLNLYFRSLPSRRHSQEIANNPKVAGNIIKQHSLGEMPEGVYFEGTTAMIDSDDERRAVFPHFQKRLRANESVLEEAKQPDGHQFYKVTVHNWYIFGRFDGDAVQKYQLAWGGGTK